VYDGIHYQVKQGSCDSGITAENTEKSRHNTDFNEDTTNESASVACSNIRLWKLDTQNEWRNTCWRLWDETAEKDSAGFVDSKENKAGVKRELLDTVKARNLAYYGHTMRKQVSYLKKETGYNARNNARCTQPTQARKTMHGLDGLDNINTWTGLPVEESIRMTAINGESTSMVWPTLGSRTATEQNRTEYLYVMFDSLCSTVQCIRAWSCLFGYTWLYCRSVTIGLNLY